MENANLRFTRYKKSDDRNQLSFMPMCLDDMIADDAEVRALELIVDKMDIRSLGFTYCETKETGRKPYDPVDMFKLYTYSYLMGSVRHARWKENAMTIEKMNEFFTSRVEGYDEHMMNNVEGCKEAYIKMARLLPANIKILLDLGCGTGLELNEIFKRFPNIEVTGIDLTQAMLDKLKEKYSSKNIELVCASYFDVEFGIDKYDIVISSQTMHHFTHEKKIKLYSKIREALKPNGQYVECDYMVIEQSEEDFYYTENQRIRAELGVPETEFYHYDTPCTIENQINLLVKTGFKEVRQVFRKENTTIIIAEK